MPARTAPRTNSRQRVPAPAHQPAAAGPVAQPAWSPPVQRAADPAIQRERAARFGHQFGQVMPDVPTPTAGAGRPLPPALRERMERSLGGDFGGVRIHEGREAGDVGAVAYTRGRNLHFAPGRYEPGSERGQALIAHELTHVVQQSQGRVESPPGEGAPVNAAPHLEAEAQANASRATTGGPGAAGASSPASAGPAAGSSGAAPIQRVGAAVPMPDQESLLGLGHLATPLINAVGNRYSAWQDRRQAHRDQRAAEHEALVQSEHERNQHGHHHEAEIHEHVKTGGEITETLGTGVESGTNALAQMGAGSASTEHEIEEHGLTSGADRGLASGAIIGGSGAIVGGLAGAFHGASEFGRALGGPTADLHRAAEGAGSTVQGLGSATQGAMEIAESSSHIAHNVGAAASMAHGIPILSTITGGLGLAQAGYQIGTGVKRGRALAAQEAALQERGGAPAGMADVMHELQSRQRKRTRGGIFNAITSGLATAGGIATLSGVGAPVGAALAATAGGLKAGAGLFKMIRQWGRNKADRAASEGHRDSWWGKIFNADKSDRKKAARADERTDWMMHHRGNADVQQMLTNSGLDEEHRALLAKEHLDHEEKQKLWKALKGNLIGKGATARGKSGSTLESAQAGLATVGGGLRTAGRGIRDFGRWVGRGLKTVGSYAMDGLAATGAAMAGVPLPQREEATA